MKRNEDSLRDLWDNMKHINTHFIGVPEARREREKGPENIFEDIKAKNIPSLGDETVTPSPGSTQSHTGLTQRGTHQDTL